MLSEIVWPNFNCDTEMYLISKWNSSTRFQLNFSLTCQVNINNSVLVVSNIQLFVCPHVESLWILLQFSNNAWQHNNALQYTCKKASTKE